MRIGITPFPEWAHIQSVAQMDLTLLFPHLLSLKIVSSEHLASEES